MRSGAASRNPLRRLADLFRLSDEAWTRYANPWSLWTRAFILPLFALAIWSRLWIGPWYAVPVLALLVWTWANPRVFPPVRPNDGWCWRVAMGEKLLTERGRRPIPRDHDLMAGFLAYLSASFALFMAWGLYTLAPWTALTATAGAVAAKFWFLERMAWLHDDMACGAEADSAPATPD